MKKVYCFNILGLNLSYQIASLFAMYIDMDERIAGKQDRSSMIIEDPPQGPPNSSKYIFFLHFGLYMKKSFQIDSPCCISTEKVLIRLLLYLICKLESVGCRKPQSCPPAWEQDEMLMNQ